MKLHQNTTPQVNLVQRPTSSNLSNAFDLSISPKIMYQLSNPTFLQTFIQ